MTNFLIIDIELLRFDVQKSVNYSLKLIPNSRCKTPNSCKVCVAIAKPLSS